MKRSWVYGVVLIGLLAFAGSGCSKKAAVAAAPTVSGVKLDIPKLKQAFGTSTNLVILKTLQSAIDNIRYGAFLDSVQGLDKLANDPGTSEEQKKVVLEVIEQVKQLSEKQPAPAPAQ